MLYRTLLVFIFASTLFFSESILARDSVAAPTYSFSLVPKKIITRGSESEIVLSLVLLPQFGLPGVELEAKNKHGKTHFSYSHHFKKFIKNQKLKKSNFKPFEKYLKGQIRQAKSNPEPYIVILDTYLKTGAAPVFTIDMRD